MKKFVIKSSALVLILIMSALMMFSCVHSWQGKNMNPDADDNENDSTGTDQVPPMPDYGFESMFPEGWTGGFYPDGPHIPERWWLETYDELILAVEKLKSNGSTFGIDYELSDHYGGSIVFDYEGDLFDVKYCITISPDNKGTDKIEFGDDLFDRKATNITVTTWCFFEDVSIDDINYSYVNDYEGFEPYVSADFYNNYVVDNAAVFPMNYVFEVGNTEQHSYAEVWVDGSDDALLRCTTLIKTNSELTEEMVRSLLTESIFYFICDDAE